MIQVPVAQVFLSDSFLAMLTQIQLKNGLADDDRLLSRHQNAFRATVKKAILSSALAVITEKGDQGLDVVLLSIGGSFTLKFATQLTEEFTRIAGKFNGDEEDRIMNQLYQEMPFLDTGLSDKNVLFQYQDGQCMARAWPHR